MIARLLTGLLLVLLLLPAGTVLAQPQQPSSDAGLNHLADCVARERSADLLFVIDESGSLKDTDPAAVRVTALEGALISLLPLAQAGADVKVAVTAFAHGAGPVVDWTTLDEANIDVVSAAVGGLRTRNNGIDTDFALAMLDAQERIAQRRIARAEAQGEACTAIVLFTDGDYDILLRNEATAERFGNVKEYAPDLALDIPDNPSRVESLGRSLLCDGDDSLVDQVRTDGTTVVSIALTSGISPEDQQFLEGLAVGGTCGQATAAGQGLHLASDDVQDLLAEFVGLSGLVGGMQETQRTQVPVCPSTPCEAGRISFDLGLPLERFGLFVDAGAPGVQAVVEGPDGQSMDLVGPARGERRQTTLSAADLSVTALTDRVVIIDGLLPRDSDAWIGEWSVTFVDPEGQREDLLANVRVQLFGTRGAEVVGDPLLEAGEATSISLRTVDRPGEPSTPSDFVVQEEVRVAIRDAGTGTPIDSTVEGPDAGNEFQVSFTPPESLAGGSLDVEVTTVVTIANQVALRPRTDRFVLAVAPPPTFPSLSTTRLTLSPVQHTEDLRTDTAIGTVAFDGPAEGSGCVWIAGVDVGDAPAATGAVRLEADADSAETCTRVSSGETVDLEVRLTPEQVRTGGVQGTVQVGLRSDRAEEVLQPQIAFDFEMLRGRDSAIFPLLLILLTAAGVVLPFMVLYALNLIAGGFAAAPLVRMARMSVRVTPSDVELVSGLPGVPIAADPDLLIGVSAPAEECREFELDVPLPSHQVIPADMPPPPPLSFRTKRHLWPLSPPSGLVESGRVTLANGGAVTRKGRMKGQVALALPGTWVFTMTGTSAATPAPDATGVFTPTTVQTDPDSEPDQQNGAPVGWLTIFVKVEAAGDLLGELVADARSVLPAHVASMTRAFAPPDEPLIVGEEGPESDTTSWSEPTGPWGESADAAPAAGSRTTSSRPLDSPAPPGDKGTTDPWNL